MGVNGYIFLDIIFPHSKSMKEFGFGLTHHSDIQKQTVASSPGFPSLGPVFYGRFEIILKNSLLYLQKEKKTMGYDISSD
jgi:hypothetical protein